MAGVKRSARTHKPITPKKIDTADKETDKAKKFMKGLVDRGYNSGQAWGMYLKRRKK